MCASRRGAEGGSLFQRARHGLFSRIRNEKCPGTHPLPPRPGLPLRVVGGNRFRNKDEIPQTFLLFKKQGEALCCSSSLPQTSVLYLDDGDTNPSNMSEKKDITRAPDDTDNLESGELYGVKTNPNPTDAVFGEISEGGPNFKSVCIFQYGLGHDSGVCSVYD